MRDKVEHFVICAFCAWFMGMIAWLCSGHEIVGACFTAFAMGIGLGAGKEMGDLAATGNRWDWGDILADALGTIFAIGIILVFHFAKG